MNRKLLLASGCALVILAGSPAAFAADEASTAATGSMMQHGQSGTVDLSRSYRSDKLIGMKVRNASGQDLGKISQIILDENGQATYVVLKSGGVLGVGAHEYLVPWDQVNLTPGQKTARIDVDKNQISSEFSAFEIETQPSATSEEPESSE